MAAAESGDLGTPCAALQVDAWPVLLGRSIPMVVPELGLAGANRFQVVREVPNWWLLEHAGVRSVRFSPSFTPSTSKIGTVSRRLIHNPAVDHHAGPLSCDDAVAGDSCE